MEEYNIEVTFRKVYKGPYFHRHTVNPFIKIIQETHVDTRSKYLSRKLYLYINVLSFMYTSTFHACV